MADDADRIDELAGTIQPAEALEENDNLSSIIDSALDAAESSDAPADDAPTERARDENGRFVAKEGTAEAEEVSEAAPNEPSADESVSTEGQDEAKPATQWTDGHFRGFTDEDRTAFMGLPPEAQDVSMRLIQQRDQHWSGQVKEWEDFGQQISPVVQAIQPHIDRMQGDVGGYLNSLLTLDHVSQYGTYAQKVDLLQRISQVTGVPVQIPEADPYADPTQPGGEAYAAIHDAQIQRQIVERQNQQYQQQLQQMQVAQAEQMWQSFTREHNADGTPKFPDADMYRLEIGQLLANGQANTLAEAYDKVSQRYDALIARRVEEKTRHLQQSQQQAVAKARRAAPVKATGSQTSGQTKQADLSSLIYSQLDAAGLQ